MERRGEDFQRHMASSPWAEPDSAPGRRRLPPPRVLGPHGRRLGRSARPPVKTLWARVQRTSVREVSAGVQMCVCVRVCVCVCVCVCVSTDFRCPRVVFFSYMTFSKSFQSHSLHSAVFTTFFRDTHSDETMLHRRVEGCLLYTSPSPRD